MSSSINAVPGNGRDADDELKSQLAYLNQLTEEISQLNHSLKKDLTQLSMKYHDLIDYQAAQHKTHAYINGKMLEIQDKQIKHLESMVGKLTADDGAETSKGASKEASKEASKD